MTYPQQEVILTLNPKRKARYARPQQEMTVMPATGNDRMRAYPSFPVAGITQSMICPQREMTAWYTRETRNRKSSRGTKSSKNSAILTWQVKCVSVSVSVCLCLCLCVCVSVCPCVCVPLKHQVLHELLTCVHSCISVTILWFRAQGFGFFDSNL
jgi:hypothetical protein